MEDEVSIIDFHWLEVGNLPGVQPYVRCLRGGIRTKRIKLLSLGVFRETKTNNEEKQLKKTAGWSKVEWAQVLGRRIRRGGSGGFLRSGKLRWAKGDRVRHFRLRNSVNTA